MEVVLIVLVCKPLIRYSIWNILANITFNPELSRTVRKIYRYPTLVRFITEPLLAVSPTCNWQAPPSTNFYGNLNKLLEFSLILLPTAKYLFISKLVPAEKCLHRAFILESIMRKRLKGSTVLGRTNYIVPIVKSFYFCVISSAHIHTCPLFPSTLGHGLPVATKLQKYLDHVAYLLDFSALMPNFIDHLQINFVTNSVGLNM